MTHKPVPIQAPGVEEHWCIALEVFSSDASLPEDSGRPSLPCDKRRRCNPCLRSHMHATLYGKKCAAAEVMKPYGFSASVLALEEEQI